MCAPGELREKICICICKEKWTRYTQTQNLHVCVQYIIHYTPFEHPPLKAPPEDVIAVFFLIRFDFYETQILLPQ